MAQRRGPTQGLLLQDVILELQISNENVAGIETGVTMLVDSVSSLSSLTKKNDDVISGNDDKMLYALKGIAIVNLGMLNTMNRLYDFFMKGDMIRAEQNRDLIEAIEDIGKESTGSARLGGGKKPSGLLGLLATVTAFAAGMIAGFFETIITKITALKWYTKIISFFEGVGKIFTRIEALVVESKLYTKFENAFLKIEKIFEGISKFFGKMLQPIMNFIRNMPISRFISNVSEIVGKVFGFIMKPFKFIMSLLGGTGGLGFLGKLFKLGKRFGGLLGKLALPLTIIMSLVESVMGAFKGYETGGVLGAVKGAMGGLLNSLIGWIIDIPKDIISWLLSKFGFENASKWLDSWNFASLFEKLWETSISSLEKFFTSIFNSFFDSLLKVTLWWESWSFDGVWKSIKDFFFGIWDSVIDWMSNVGGQITDVFGNAVDFLNDFYKSVLRAVLPDRNNELNPGNPMWLLSRLIPDKVYEWANSPSTVSTASNTLQPMPGANGSNLMNSGAMGGAINVYNIVDNSRGSTNMSVSATNIAAKGQSPGNSPGGSTLNAGK